MHIFVCALLRLCTQSALETVSPPLAVVKIYFYGLVFPPPHPRMYF